MTYPVRPPKDITAWATGTGATVSTPTDARVSTGMAVNDPLPAGVFNLVARWAGMFAAINPEDTSLIGAGGVAGPILDYIRWRDPLLTTKYLSWDQTGAGGDLRGELSRSSWTWNTGATETVSWVVLGSNVTWTRGPSSTGSMRLVGYPLSIAPVSSVWQGVRYENDGTNWPEDTYSLTPGRGRGQVWPPNQTWSVYTPTYPTGGGIALADSSGAPVVGTETLRVRVGLREMPHFTGVAGYILTRLEMSVTLSWTLMAVAANNKVTLTLYRGSATSIATGTIDASGGAGAYTLDILSGTPHTVVAADGNDYWIDIVVQASSGTDVSVECTTVDLDVQTKAAQ